MFKNKKTIEYWTSVKSLTEVEDAKPTQYKNIKPSWWKDVPSNGDFLTVKNCPSFYDLFSNAYVLRMWCDSKIIKQEGGAFDWITSSNKFIWRGHPSDQMIDFTPSWMRSRVWATAKPMNPWFIKTPRGYSTYQMPLMYDANPDFVAASGVIHTDRYHASNIPMFLFSEKDEFDIKLGTPLALHIPFKREKFSLDVREQTEGDKYLEEKTHLMSTLKFKNSYRNALKEIYKNS